MAVTPRDIVDKVFTKSFRGYDEEEVDLFLDDIIKELESKNNEIRSQYARISELLARLNAASQVYMPPNMLATQQSAEEFLTSANMKARVIVQQAEQYAAKLRAQAEQAAVKSAADAQTAAQDTLQRAEREAKLIVRRAQREAIGYTGAIDEESVRGRFAAATGDAAAPSDDAPFELESGPAAFDVFLNPPEAEPNGLPPFDPSWEVTPQGALSLEALPPLPPGGGFLPETDVDPLGDWGDDELTLTLAKLGVDI